jgi:hypothetical protein
MSVMKFLDRLREIARREPRHAEHARRQPRRRDPDFVGGSRVKDIEDAPPGRAQELAGHAVERVET